MSYFWKYLKHYTAKLEKKIALRTSQTDWTFENFVSIGKFSCEKLFMIFIIVYVKMNEYEIFDDFPSWLPFYLLEKNYFQSHFSHKGP